MYQRVKPIAYTVSVDVPEPQFAALLLRQFGGADGKLSTVMQYSVQGTYCDQPRERDLLMALGGDEIAQLSVLGALARLHRRAVKENGDATEADPLIAIASGEPPDLFDPAGSPWSGGFQSMTGALCDDLTGDAAAEAWTRGRYDLLLPFTDDAGTKDALRFLSSSDSAHQLALLETLTRLGAPLPGGQGRRIPVNGAAAAPEEGAAPEESPSDAEGE